MKRLATTLLLLMAMCVAGCKRGGTPPAQAGGPPTAFVTTTAAVARDVPVYIDAIGKTVPTETVTVIPQVGGKVIAAHVEDGAYVKKGQLLFEIDPRPFQAEFASANARLAQSVAELDLAKAEFRRVEELKPTNVISQLEWDQKKSGLGVAEARVESAKAAIQTAELNLEYTKLFSPIDGRAGVRWTDVGNVVKANEGGMYIIQKLDPIYAEFTVTENDLGTVRKFLSARGMEVGSEASLGLKALVDIPGDSSRILSALGTSPAATRPTTRPTAREGQLTFLDNTVQSSAGTVKLRATVPNSDRYFWPGQFVNVRLVLTVKKDAVLVPTAAQQIGQQGPYVYVVRSDSTAELRPITPGQRQGDLLVVEQGLQAGEKVVLSGHMQVIPGGPLKVTNDATEGVASKNGQSNL